MPAPISEIAQKLGLFPHEISPYGHDKAKVTRDGINRFISGSKGKLVVVTAISPTPAGEGKTVTSIGLGDGLRHIGKNALICIRQPSLGPVFGMKGGAAGGGKAQAYPAEDMNLHFTGDFHAITATHNLLTAMMEAHIYHKTIPMFDPNEIWWGRALDVTDRSLRKVVTGLGGKSNGSPRETGFMITAASEIMAIVTMATDVTDLQKRLGDIVLGISTTGEPIRARELNAVGAMSVLLRDAILPNLIQTLEGTPVLVHAGPFGNIATGCNSIIADKLGLGLADYVVTEAGFGSDLGFEKFCDIMAPSLGSGPDVVVIVATIRGLKAHSGQCKLIPGKPLPESLKEENVPALRAGAVNLKRHIKNVQQFGCPVVVAINHFPGDTELEITTLKEIVAECGVRHVAVSDGFAEGGAGTAELARQVVDAAENIPANFHSLYDPSLSLFDKIETIARSVYGSSGVKYGAGTRTRLRLFEKWGFGNLPVCIAKTQYSFSHDPSLLGSPSGFTLPVESVEIAAGAGFVRILCGDIMTMPGMPAVPAAFRMQLSHDGEITGVVS